MVSLGEAIKAAESEMGSKVTEAKDLGKEWVFFFGMTEEPDESLPKGFPVVTDGWVVLTDKESGECRRLLTAYYVWELLERGLEPVPVDLEL